jgi:hypothetical protein
MELVARLYRRADAAKYLGMSVFTFDSEVRPYLTDIPIAKQGVAFDRFELDAWTDHHIQANGRPAQKEGLWLESHPASKSGATHGGSINASADSDFEKALKLTTSKRRSVI